MNGIKSEAYLKSLYTSPLYHESIVNIYDSTEYSVGARDQSFAVWQWFCENMV